METYVSYNEETDQYTISVHAGTYTLPPATGFQFKLDPIGYFIAYIEGNLINRIPLKEYEMEEMLKD
jgi:hypothetical protein